MTDLKDGGTRKTYGIGAQKEDDSKTEGKGAYHLLPTHPIRRVAEIYRKGAMKYSARNWEKGIPLTRFLDSAKRHLDQFAEGMEDEDHLHQAIWNLFGLSHTIEQIKRGNLPTSLDDLPSYPIPGEKFREPGPGLDLPDEEKGLWPVKPMEEEKKERLEAAGWKVSGDVDTFIAGADCPVSANEVETTCANCIHYDCPLPEEMGYCDISNRAVYTYWTCSEVEERKEEKPEPTAPLMPSGPFTHCRTCSSFSINKQWCDTYKHYTLPHWNCGKWS